MESILWYGGVYLAKYRYSFYANQSKISGAETGGIQFPNVKSKDIEPLSK